MKFPREADYTNAKDYFSFLYILSSFAYYLEFKIYTKNAP